MNRLLSLCTVVSILGLWPNMGHGAPLCSQVLEASESTSLVQESVGDQLNSLRQSLLELRLRLKNNKDQENRLKALDKLSEDPREIAYVLQGAYRLMLSHPQAKSIFVKEDLKALEKGLNAMKNLEKTLGVYQVQADLFKTAKDLKVPKAFKAYLKEKRDDASVLVIAELKMDNFLDQEITGLQKHLERIRSWNSKDLPAAKILIRDSLQVELQRVQQKVVSEMKPLILKTDYTSVELEEGAHAFRRSLRWIKVYVLAYAPYFYTNTKSEFGTVASPDKILLNLSEFQALSTSIDQLRKIKKPGEMREKMAHALMEFGWWHQEAINDARAYQIIDGLMDKKFKNIEVKTQEILRNYEDHGGFLDLILEAK